MSSSGVENRSETNEGYRSRTPPPPALDRDEVVVAGGAQGRFSRTPEVSPSRDDDHLIANTTVSMDETQVGCNTPIAAWDTALRVIMVSVMGGLMLGALPATTPLLVHYHEIGLDCPRLSETQDLCIAAPGCNWEPEAKHACDYYESCEGLPQAECLEKGASDGGNLCKWTAENGCMNLVGWAPGEVGLLASAITVGATFGSLIAGSTSKAATRKRDAAATGAVCVFGTILQMIVWQLEMGIKVLCVARAVAGLGIGAVCVIVPLYNGEACPLKYRAQSGAMFTVFLTFGIVLVAKIGYTLANDLRGAHLVQGVCVLICLQYLVVLQIQHPHKPDDTRAHKKNDDNEVEEGQQQQELQNNSSETTPMVAHSPDPRGPTTTGASDGEGAKKKAPASTRARASSLLAAASGSGKGVSKTTGPNLFDQTYRKPLMAASFLALAQQMTGFNALMNYAPDITAASGFDPLYGNFLVMLWNFISAVLSIPLAKAYSGKTMFLTGLSAVTVCCFVMFLGLSPYFFHHTTRSMFSSVGLFSFITAFEIGMAPFFFILATEVFPVEVKEPGCGYTNVLQFFFNIIINFGFPIAVAVLSGGGAQTIGLSTVFAIFGVIGLIAVIALRRLLGGDDKN